MDGFLKRGMELWPAIEIADLFEGQVGMLVEDPEGFARIDRRTASDACDHIGFEITVFFQYLSDGVYQRLRRHFIKDPYLRATLPEKVHRPRSHSQFRHHLVGHNQRSLPRDLSQMRERPPPPNNIPWRSNTLSVFTISSSPLPRYHTKIGLTLSIRRLPIDPAPLGTIRISMVFHYAPQFHLIKAGRG